MALTETAVNRINSTFGYKQLIPFDCLILIDNHKYRVSQAHLKEIKQRASEIQVSF